MSSIRLGLNFRGIRSLERRSMDSPGKRGDTPLHLAARSGDVAHAQRILADLDRALFAEMAARQNLDGETPLYVAAEKGHAEVVREIFKVSDVQTAGIKASNSFDAFHIAAKQGHFEILKEMLQALPALAMTTNSVNATALDTAATQGHVDIVNLLLETDASLARIRRNNGKSVLHSAATMGHVEIVRSLLNKDPGIGFRTDKKGQTALHMASKGQNMEIMVELLMPDVSVIHIEDSKGNRPLHVATRKGNIIIVQTLLSVEGIEVNAVNRSGETAFGIAEKMNDRLVINILKLAGGETAKQQVHPQNLARLEKPHRMGMQSQSAILPWSCVGDSRMDDMYIELDALECAVDGSKKPCNLKFSFLEFITKQFSDELKIGHGGCGLVYKGILPNRVIAVKKLLNNHTIDDKMFHQEVTSLMMVAHKNIVRLLGYCSHTEEKAIDVAGKIIMAEIRERLLCFEYVTNGSLENHITDELRGLEWYTRYQIIKGICEGLHHFHKEKHIIHLDLKPANILLDDDMVPKISDFGLSRLDEKSHTLSAERRLTLGYCAPEYLQRGKRSAKSDIYSLGVIITELVTGSRGNPCITKVLRRWKHRWNKSAIDTQLWFKLVSTCLDLAQRCRHIDPTDRPNIWDIITDLNKMDNADTCINNDTECLKLENMLDIEPLEMHFPFELNKHITGCIELTNDTDDYFAFRMSSISVRPYFIHPFKGIIPPRSQCSVTIMLQQPQERVRPQFPCKDEFSAQSTRVDMNLTALDITEDMFHEEPGKVVDEVTLKVVLDSPSPPDNIRADSVGMAGSVPLTFSPISSTSGQIV